MANHSSGEIDSLQTNRGKNKHILKQMEEKDMGKGVSQLPGSNQQGENQTYSETNGRLGESYDSL